MPCTAQHSPASPRSELGRPRTIGISKNRDTMNLIVHLIKPPFSDDFKDEKHVVVTVWLTKSFLFRTGKIMSSSPRPPWQCSVGLTLRVGCAQIRGTELSSHYSKSTTIQAWQFDQGSFLLCDVRCTTTPQLYNPRHSESQTVSLLL